MTFSDLKFNPHPVQPYFNNQARYDFPNGYGISVVNGECAYCDEDTYEVGILKDGNLCYNTTLTSDVLSYQTPDDIDSILKVLEKYEQTVQEDNSPFY